MLGSNDSDPLVNRYVANGKKCQSGSDYFSLIARSVKKEMAYDIDSVLKTRISTGEATFWTRRRRPIDDVFCS